MKNPTFISMLLVFTGCLAQTSQSNPALLFRIYENNKTGYINAAGKVVIKPVFYAAGEFSEGLAEARLNGDYGYINHTGAFVIQPQFDYATPFCNGMAIVFISGKPFFINKSGHKPFECNYAQLSMFQYGVAVVKSESGKYGCINMQGKLIADTVYKHIRPFYEGLAVVSGLNHHPYGDREKGIKKNFEVGVIDSLGTIIVPFGKYKEIADFENGYFRIVIPAEPWDTIDGYSKQVGFIDRQGNPVMVKQLSRQLYNYGKLNCGLSRVSMYDTLKKEKEGVSFSSNNNYYGYVNIRGETVFADTSCRTAEDFSCNRAFVKLKDKKYSVINTKGELLAKDSFRNYKNDGFINGYAFVSNGSKWGVIDTHIQYVVKPQFDNVDIPEGNTDYFFFHEKKRDAANNSYYMTGIAKYDGTIMLTAVMENYDRYGFVNGLIKCIVEGRFSYIDRTGKIVYTTPDNETAIFDKVNIDYMLRGYFYASSKPDKNDLGGHGYSGKKAIQISEKDRFAPDVLSVFVDVNSKNKMGENFLAYTVYITNRSKKDIQFSAQDSRLYMKVQAQDVNGQWKDIEYLPSSWCGNSYHTLTLETDYQWALATPAYEGSFKTKLRIELQYNDPDDKTESRYKKEMLKVYSNEYECSINPGQFWRKEDYHPRGIMDPYND